MGDAEKTDKKTTKKTTMQPERGIMISIGEPAGEHEDGVWYAPDFGSNRDLPQADQAAVCIVPMSAREMQKLNQANIIKSRSKMSDPFASMQRREAAKREMVLRERVVGVRNCWIYDRATKTEKRAETAEEFLDAVMKSTNAAVLSLLEDILNAIVNESTLEEGLAKK